MKKTESVEPKPETPPTAPAPASVDAEELPATIQTGNVTPEQLEELKTRAAKADENWERLLRTTADFDNFKKRAAREKQDAIKFANESLLQKLIPVLDNFEMALAAAQTQFGRRTRSPCKTAWP